MITQEKNPLKEERIEKRKTFEMLKDVRLPKYYEFVDDCIEIRYRKYWGFTDIKVADILFISNDTLKVIFVDEEDLELLRSCFAQSKTKFKLSVNEYYY